MRPKQNKKVLKSSKKITADQLEPHWQRHGLKVGLGPRDPGPQEPGTRNPGSLSKFKKVTRNSPKV